MIRLISKKEALLLGYKYYLTGEPCIRGHIDFRSTSNNGCRSCIRIRNYERSLLPHVKEANRLNKKTKKYKEQQKEYKKRKNPNARPVNKQDFKINLDPSSAEYKREYARNYYHANKDRIKKLATERDNSGRAEYARKWSANYRKTPEGSAIYFMRKCLSRCLINKTDTTEKILGYKSAELKEHIERQFLDGMSWSNRSEWHIDHIIPVSHFLKKGVADPKVINCLTNLRPIWAKDNLKKGREVLNLI